MMKFRCYGNENLGKCCLQNEKFQGIFFKKGKEYGRGNWFENFENFEISNKLAAICSIAATAIELLP